MKYGKLTDGVLVPAPTPLCWGGFKTYNPSDALCAEAGYLPIVETPYPETAEGEAKYYTSSWEEQEGQIVQIWTETDAPEPAADSPTWQETTDSRLTSLESTVDALIVAQLEVVSGDV